MKARVLEASVSFAEQPFARPLVLSSGTITSVTEARSRVRVRVEGREAEGRGSIYLSDLWAWPHPALTHETRDAELRRLCEEMAADLPSRCGDKAAHPLELGLRLHAEASREGPWRVPSRLARILCASPFDAAIHDATGIALGISSFSFYDTPAPIPSADPHFPGAGACAAIRECLRPPARELCAWWVVGKDDSFEDEVGPAVRRGYRGFKLKIMGRDAAADAGRIAEVYRAVVRLGAPDPRLVADSNEANPDAASVRDMLERLRRLDAGAYGALDYLEQPTARDILAHRHDWREVSRLKPVMLDEGLTGLDLLEEARGQGWGGLALKTCKGHSFSLVCAAWARRRGMRVSLQDLTNPGLALLHAALFAAHVPTCNGVELNSPQYTPAANAAWLPRLPDLFDPKGGLHRIPDPVPPGLGSSL